MISIIWTLALLLVLSAYMNQRSVRRWQIRAAKGWTLYADAMHLVANRCAEIDRIKRERPAWPDPTKTMIEVHRNGKATGSVHLSVLIAGGGMDIDEGIIVARAVES